MTAIATLKDIFLRNQGRIAVILIILVWGYMLVNFGEQSWRANRLQAEVDEQRDAIQAIRDDNIVLRTELETMQSPAYDDYVSQVARRDLSLAKSGETLLLVRYEEPSTIDDSSTGTAAHVSEDEPNWRRWLGEIFGND